jgi:uncharacterized protein with FMN-binding domain
MMKEYIPGTEILKPLVELTGKDGNAYSIMGRVRRALQKAGAPAEVLDGYYNESTKGDYDNLLRVAIKYVRVV